MTNRREDLGSWLEGTPGADGRPGLGLPRDGSGSIAPLGRRAAALAVDWGLSMLISHAFLAGHPMATLAVFGVSTVVLVSTLGTTIGHRVLGLQVVRLSDAVHPGPATAPPPGLLLGSVRTALLCLVIPAVIWDGNGRGMHDVAAGTVILRR